MYIFFVFLNIFGIRAPSFIRNIIRLTSCHLVIQHTVLLTGPNFCVNKKTAIERGKMKFIDNSKIKRQPALAEQIAALLIKAIDNGDFKPNEILPSENELSKMLNVSRTVLREAMARMKQDGLLESVKGGRTQVSSDPAGLAFRLDADAHQDENYLIHLYELRAIVEPEAAAMAAFRANDKDIVRINNKFELLERALENSDDGTEESLAFHKAVMVASGNNHIARFAGWVDKKIWSFVRNGDFDHNAKMISEVQHEHKDIILAIENRKPRKAKKLARQHVIDAARRNGLKLTLP